MIEIKNRYTGAVMYSGHGETIRQVVEAAVAARANLADAYLARANLAGANLADANLAGAYLADAYLAGAYLADANLAGAYLADANLADAYLADANLAGAYLDRAYLADAYLARAYLARANLADAYLTDAYLADAYLARANLADAKWTDTLTLTMVPIQISGLAYRVAAINGTHLQIGCKLYTVEEWESFDDAAIVDMNGARALKFWRQWKEPLLAIARAMVVRETVKET